MSGWVAGACLHVLTALTALPEHAVYWVPVRMRNVLCRTGGPAMSWILAEGQSLWGLACDPMGLIPLGSTVHELYQFRHGHCL